MVQIVFLRSARPEKLEIAEGMVMMQIVAAILIIGAENCAFAPWVFGAILDVDQHA
jgi:hypothetical protein